MTTTQRQTTKPTHPWLHKIRVAFAPDFTSPVLEEVMDGLSRHFHLQGHLVQTAPDNSTDIVLTSAPFNEPIGWREALLFTIRRRFDLDRTPSIFTLMHLPRTQFQHMLDRFRDALAKEPPDPADYDFPGLTSHAHEVLIKQGRRGGPLLVLERLVQAQAKSIQLILVVGDDHPLAAYHFDLVGAHPRSEAEDAGAFYEDIVLRIVTTVSTSEVNQHKVIEEPIPSPRWQSLTTPRAMRLAGRELGKRNFFTDMVYISDLVQVPAVGEVIANQYSEGCFATWEPKLDALITTVTGSARPVDKGGVTDDDLAVVTGVRPGGNGVFVRHIESKSNDPPSSEALELLDLDSPLPTITLDKAWGISAQAPVARSKLHGHRGISIYDPRRVEYAPLDPAYYHYLVSCGTKAQATGIKRAFARSESLQNPDDPRQLAFTVLPGHGVVIVEKWVAGKTPFQTMWEFMDAGYLQVDRLVPQGPMGYAPGADGRMVLQAA